MTTPKSTPRTSTTAGAKKPTTPRVRKPAIPAVVETHFQKAQRLAAESNVALLRATEEEAARVAAEKHAAENAKRAAEVAARTAEDAAAAAAAEHNVLQERLNGRRPAVTIVPETEPIAPVIVPDPVPVLIPEPIAPAVVPVPEPEPEPEPATAVVVKEEEEEEEEELEPTTTVVVWYMKPFTDVNIRKWGWLIALCVIVAIIIGDSLWTWFAHDWLSKPGGITTPLLILGWIVAWPLAGFFGGRMWAKKLKQ